MLGCTEQLTYTTIAVKYLLLRPVNWALEPEELPSLAVLPPRLVWRRARVDERVEDHALGTHLEVRLACKNKTKGNL